MPRAVPIPVAGHGVLVPEQVALVRQHLKDLLSSHAFAGSKRTQDFLLLIVNHTLEGDIESLRERMIGAELFGRPISYDTGSDSVVRVRASEVRKKLALYYSGSKEKLTVRIELPSGSYVPRFHFEPEPIKPSSQAEVILLVSAEHAAVPHPDQTGSNTAQNAPGDSSHPLRRSKGSRPILIVSLLGLGLFLGFALLALKKWAVASPSPSEIRSVAILPLQNLSSDPAQEYFADGMTEELINDFGQVSTLRVISLTSAMSYKGTKKKLPEIARELSVDGVVEGGVMRDGNHLRISVQLIDARTDRPVWARTYVRNLSSDLPWQGEVAQAIAEEISIKVTPQEQARLDRKRAIDPEAQDLYLHGILLRESDDCAKAINYFNRAIDKNPAYAQAHSALASCYGRLGESGRIPYEEAFSRQKAEALRATELDDSLSEAHAELANTAMTLDWDWPTAEAQFRLALELNPNSATSHEKYAFYLIRTGHQREALAEIERSVELDPVSPSTFHAEGFIYYFSKQYDQALGVSKTVQGLKMNLPDWNFLRGDVYVEKGMYTESIESFLRSGDGPYALGHLGNAYARAHQSDAANRTIAELEEHVRKDGVGRYEIALVYAGLGDKKEAFKWLEDAFHAHDVGLVYLKVDPCLDPLRSDPRFTDLMRRVGLT